MGSRGVFDQIEVSFVPTPVILPLSCAPLTPVLSAPQMPLARVLALMELRGIAVEPSSVNEMQSSVSSKIIELSNAAFALVGKRFNLNSPEQVAEVLYQTLKLPPPQSTTKHKHLSTSEEDLVAISSLHPVVKVILDYRGCSKMMHTYIEGLRPYMTADLKAPTSSSGNAFEVLMSSRTVKELSTAHRVYPQWHQTTVRTGRLSCSKPNMQQIPNEQSVGTLYLNPRSFFTAPAGKLLVSADYSQIEVRIMAHCAKDRCDCCMLAGSKVYSYNTPLPPSPPQSPPHTTANAPKESDGSFLEFWGRI